MNKENKGISTTSIIKVTIVALLVVLIVIAVIFAVTTVKNNNSGNSGIVLDASAVSISDMDDDATEQSKIKIPGFSEVVFPSQETHVQITLMNPEGNSCGFVYVLYVDSTEEEPIYTSGLIEPGKAVTEIDLNHGLEAGEYTLYINVCTYSEEDMVPMNGALVTAKLTVY